MRAGLHQFALRFATWFVALLTFPGEGKRERARRLSWEMQRRWLHEWAETAPPGEPIPEMGFRCERCEYPLAGLTERQCPECGNPILP